MKDEALKLALEALEKSIGMLERADCSTGYCCCGSSVDGHTFGDGHSPVDEGEYYQGNALEYASKAITAIKQALEAPVQEPWNPNDTSYRPGGLPQDFTTHEVDSADAWSEWVCPDPEQYFMKCCDCGLVHEMQFKVAKYSKGDECEFVDDANLQAVFRARRISQVPEDYSDCHGPDWTDRESEYLK